MLNPSFLEVDKFFIASFLEPTRDKTNDAILKLKNNQLKGARGVV